MSIAVVIFLTVALGVATPLFFAWAHKYGDEWNWEKIKEGYKRGWPSLLAVTLLIVASIVVIWYALPEPKSALLAFAKVWGVWVPMWGIVGGVQILRSLYKIFRETHRAPKPWIAFVAFGVLLLIGSAVWYGFEVAKIANAMA